jgi:hypothetical protein
LKLEETFDPGSLTVQPQWSPFVMFLICFVLALVLVWYMLRIFFAGKESAA